MKTGAGLAFICVGAILAFAVTANTSVFNLHTAGWVIMLIGVIGLLLPRRTYGWLGRRVQVRRSCPGGANRGSTVQQIQGPPYVAPNPGTSRFERGLPVTPTLLDQDDDPIEQAYRSAGSTEVVEDLYEDPS
jgi:hypothetical protein